MATGDLLSDDDVPEIVRQIFLVRNESETLGRILKLPKATVDSIHRQYSKPKDRLFHVIDKFVKQLEPMPTWEVIVDALRNPLIDLPRLALELEEKYCFHDGPTTNGKQTSQGTLNPPERPRSANSLRSSSREDFLIVSSGTHHNIDPVKRLRGIPDPLIVTKSGGQLLSVVLARSSEEVRKMIDELDKRFSGLKKTIRDYLERSRVLVKDVADVLTSLSPDDDEHHKIFLESHVERLYTAVNHSVLFGTMNFHWNYLDPSLLDTLVKKLDLKEIKAQMDGYKSVLQRFRMKTPLSLFCRAQKRKRVKLSPEFHEVVAHFTWPEDDVITLEAVEVFRQEYASHFNLREFAMMLAEVRPGSFIVMWLVPKSIVDTLKGVVPRTILIKNFVTSLKVAGTCIYCIHKESTRREIGSETTDNLSEDNPTAPDDVLPSCCLICSESDSCEQRVLPEEVISVEPDQQYSAPLQEDTVSGSTEQSQVEGETGQGPVEVTPFLDPTSTEIAAGSTEQSQEEESQTEQNLIVTPSLDLTSIDPEIAGSSLTMLMDTVSLASGVPAESVTEEVKAKNARIPASPERSDTDDNSFSYAPPESSIFISHSLPVEVPFLEEPSQNFSCPVTYSLMLHPHVTSCCGQNLSQEAALRIQRGGGACPLCRASQWSTVLNKELQRQVRGLRVFCCHEDRGCVWRGQLYEFDRHVRSCPMKDAPLLRQLPKSTEGRTQLHDAAKRGDVAEVRRLLSSPININSRTIITGETALHLASERGHVEVVCLIVNAQADLNIADKNGRTPLYWAAVRGYKEVVEILLDNGADIHICRKDGKTPLICASLRGHVVVVRLLLEKGATVNGCDKGGHSPVFAASQNGHMDVVDLLVQAGADIHLATTESGNVPLMIAAQEGHTGTVQRLLDAGATINYQNKDGKTPLTCASLRGHVEVVSLLLEKGAGINICEKDGVSPLFSASWKGHTEVVDLLVQAGANIHLTTTAHGNSALGIAARKGHTATLQSLLEAGANINYQNKIGTTALHQAAMNGHSEAVRLLLRAGAIDIPDKTGKTALDKARACGHKDVEFIYYIANRTVTLL